MRNPHHTDEDGCFLWFCGMHTIRVIDTASLAVIKEVPNLIPYFSDAEFGVALRGVSRNRGNEFVVSFVISNIWSLIYHKNGIESEPLLGS